MTQKKRPKRGQSQELFVLYEFFMSFNEWNEMPNRENTRKLTEKYQAVTDFYEEI